MVDTEGEFIPPPEAPVFEPTWEEFQDPLGYIAKIRPIAEKTGICKVRPPVDWQPPFAVDIDVFKFTPRVQRLNELEAKTRVKLNFLDRLAKFWELQGTPLHIPLVERKYLDLYMLHKIVHEEGGFEIVCRERKWSKVVSRMTFGSGKGVGSSLRQHYEKILYPFDLFEAGVTLGTDVSVQSSPPHQTEQSQCADPSPTDPAIELAKMKSNKKELSPVKTEPTDTDGKDNTSENNSLDGSVVKEEGFESRRSKRIAKENIQLSSNPELRKLQFYGPGPKMIIPEHLLKEEAGQGDGKDSTKHKILTRDKKNVSYVDLYMCHTCGQGDREDYMLLCDGCDDAFHTFCLIPPLASIPQGDWRCPKCVAKECSRPKTAYGFSQALKEYSLQTYGEMADQFKLDYFNMPVHLVPCSTVEREFWRLVNCIEEDVVVEYGADIHAMEFGSGFPTEGNRAVLPEDQKYCSSGWNLNNLPVLDQSLLKYIGGDISGMKVPWCYVGMCFSSFCWHTEDHWSYAINYMHWGEPKTWYGVPGSKAQLLEECMKKNAPELFEQSPDLLHQLTTIMNPNVLMAYGVPVVRTNQCAGEFVITFPRAYHAGFNQGYNFAEAVNFCPADWIVNGRNCLNHYRNLSRQCVFSHEELICKMATNPEQMNINLAAAVYKDMLAMVEEEKKLRKKLLHMNITGAEREAFELLPDDERQCYVCKATCFLSAITCSCSPNRLVCIHHADKLCGCSPSRLCLRYRYTLDELPAMLYRLKIRAESFDNWAYKVKMLLEDEGQEKVDLAEFRELLREARDKQFPDSPLLQALIEAVNEAEKCSNVASQLLGCKVRTRNRQSGESKYVAKLTLDELECFSEQIQTLPCHIKEAQQIKSLLDHVDSIQQEVLIAIEESLPNTSRLQTLVDKAITLDVELSETSCLKQLLRESQWLDEVQQAMTDCELVTIETMRRLLEAGVALTPEDEQTPHGTCQNVMADLQERLTISEKWEEKARFALQARPRHSLPTIEAILEEVGNVPASLPSINQLVESVDKAKEWMNKVKDIQNEDHYPYLSTLEMLVNKGRPISVQLDKLPQLESQVFAAKSWRERTSKTFLKKNSPFSLVEILSPRTNIGLHLSGKLRRRKLVKEIAADRESCGDSHIISGIKIEEKVEPDSVVVAFSVAKQNELEVIREIRRKNTELYQTDGSLGNYCVCRRPPAGLMLQCELCRDWFHSSCVPLPKSANLKAKTAPADLMLAARDIKFFCPFCLRSRRPRLETILSLLVSLQKLPVRLLEGEALQCLTEQAMAWQDKARQILATDELSTTLRRLSVLSKNMEQAANQRTEQASNQKPEQINNDTTEQTAINLACQKSSHEMEQTANDKTELVTNERTEMMSIELMSMTMTLDVNGPETLSPDCSTVSPTSSNSLSGLTSVDVQQQGTTSPVSPVDLTASQHTVDDSPDSQKIQCHMDVASSPGDSSLIQQDADDKPKLSSELQRDLEELMLEGDLLEVSLDETWHIWKILQSCSQNTNSRIHYIQGTETEMMQFKAEKKKRRKELGEGQASDEFKIKKKKKIILTDGIDVKDANDKKLKDPDKKRRKRSVISMEDVHEDCAALKCIKPSGEEVNWVQCDSCEGWFHLLCVGLAEDEVSGNEDYICFKCNRKKSGQIEPLIGGVLSPADLTTLSKFPVSVPKVVSEESASNQPVQGEVKTQLNEETTSTEPVRKQPDCTILTPSCDKPQAKPITMLAEPQTEPLTMLPGPQTEPLTMLPGPQTEPLTMLPGPQTEQLTMLPGPQTEPLTMLPGPQTEPLTMLPGPQTEPLTMLPGPQTEPLTMLPGPQTKPLTMLPGLEVPDAQSVVATPLQRQVLSTEDTYMKEDDEMTDDADSGEALMIEIDDSADGN